MSNAVELRDFLAASALPAIITAFESNNKHPIYFNARKADETAAVAYLIADSMLMERMKGPFKDGLTPVKDRVKEASNG